jgi:hypothetical protein
MKFKIEAGRTFDEVQEEFNKIFPYLKITFSSAGNSLSNICLVGINNGSRINDDIVFNSDATVAEIVNQFKELFSLQVKISRKSNSHWIETLLTDSWTLEKQNRAGKQFNEY